MHSLIPLLSLVALSSPLSAATWYVDALSGAGDADGRAPENAFATLQSAVDVAGPGDRILVAAGVYYEHVVLNHGGTAEAPLEIIAEDPGCYQTVLSGAVEAVRNGEVEWECVDDELGLYSIPLDYRPVRVLADRVDLLAYESLDDLKAFRRVADSYPGNSHGFAWDDETQQLYVRLRADGKYGETDPNYAIMAVAPPTAGGRWGSEPNRRDNFLIALNFSGEAHVIIDGFTFETPGLAGVFSEADDLTVRNAWFYGCRYGVAGREDGGTARVQVEHCFYTQFPAYTDIEEIFRSEAEEPTISPEMRRTPIHWQRKAGFLPVTGGLSAPYSYETGLIRRIGQEWTIRANWIWEAFEAFSSGSVSNSTDSVIENNRIERICDNAFETEEHAKNLTIRGNRIVNAFEAFSWQPLNGAPLPGPIYIYDNVYQQTANDADLWKISGSLGGVFKMGIKYDRFWEDGSMGDIPPDVTPSPGGFWVAHNTIIAPHKRIFTALNPAGRRFENFFFLNNIFIAGNLATRRQPDGPEGVIYRENVAAFIMEDSEAALALTEKLAGSDSDGELDLPLPPQLPRREIAGALPPCIQAGPLTMEDDFQPIETMDLRVHAKPQKP